MDLKERQWYLAEHNFDDLIYYNYFFKIGKTVKYISLNIISYDVEIVRESYEEFEENMDPFNFDEREPDGKWEKEVLENIFK